MFKAVCPHCHTAYKLDNAFLGKKAACRVCRQVFILEEGSTAKSVLSGRADADSFFELQERSQKTAPYDQPVMVKPQIPSGAWNVGDVILGTYEVKEIAPQIPFAAGGVGIVNRVHHREWDIDLAVKSPKSEFFQSENGKRSYEKEAQTWIELGLHPNIVTCYLVRRIDGIPRLFAEFVPDGSLRDWMSNRKLYEGDKKSSLLRILDIAVQFAWGLNHAHRQGLLHLDVKPANVMMSGETAKISDFGLSQSLIDRRLAVSENEKKSGKSQFTKSQILSSYGNVGLTPSYCSPEQYRFVNALKVLQFENLPVMTVGTDIWSWAVSILALFVGNAPCKHGGQTARSVCENILKEPPQRPELPEIPPSVGTLLMHCFEEEPTKRPSSMEEIANRLISIYRDISGEEFPRLPPISATGTPETLNNLAASMLDLNKPNEAAKLFSRALTLQPWYPEVTYNQVLSAWRNAKTTDLGVIERLEMLVKMRSENASAFYTLGLAQRERGNISSAADAFSDALEIEYRDEIQRAATAAKELIGSSVRCLDRFILAPESENNVHVDTKGELLLCASDAKTLQLRSTSTGEVLHSFKIAKEKLPSSGRLAMSDDLLYELVILDNELVLRRMGTEKNANVFDAVGWQRYFQVNRKKRPIQSLCSEKKLLGEVVEDRVEITDLETKKRTGTLLGHDGNVTAFVFSPDGHFAVTGSEDRCLRIWELPSCRCLRTLTGLRGTVDAVYLDPNNQFALSLLADGELRIWDIRALCAKPFRAPILLSHITSSEEISRQQHEMQRICNDIRQVVRGSDYGSALQLTKKAETMKGWNSARITLEADGTIDLIRRHCERQSLKSLLCSHTFKGSEEPVTTIAASLDANLIASAGRDTVIRIWDVAKQCCLNELEGHWDWIRSVEMTSDAKFLVSGSWDATVKIWNIQTGQCIRTLNEKFRQLTKITIHPLGRLLAVATGSGKVFVWDVLTNKPLASWQTHHGIINALRFSRNGHFLVTGGDDNKVCVWQNKVSAFHLVKTITEHQSPITSALFSVNAKQIFSADTAGQVVVSSVQSDVPEDKKQKNEKTRTTQLHLAGISSLNLSPDERFLFSSSKDASVKITKLSDWTLEKQVEGHPDAVTAMVLNVLGNRLLTACGDGVVRIWQLNWNFIFPGWQEMSPQAEEVLKNLVQLYSPDGVTVPKLNEVDIRRILLEMEYRGFGTIPEQVILKKLENPGV